MFKSLIAFILSGLMVFSAGTNNDVVENTDIVDSAAVETVKDKVIFDLAVDENAVSGQREAKTTEEIQAELNKKVEDGMITISINLCPVFADGSSEDAY